MLQDPQFQDERRLLLDTLETLEEPTAPQAFTETATEES